MSSNGPFNLVLKASNDSIVKGCPGVQRSFPRIEGILEIRSNNGLPVLIRKITASLINTQEISVPSSSGIGSSSLSRSYDLLTSGVYGGSEEILGLDIPFVLPITQDVIASGEIPKFSMINKSCIRFVVTYGNRNIAESTFDFPVPIKKYNTLPIYRQFLDPGPKMVDSPDRVVLLEYSMPKLSVGPSDLIEVFFKASIPATTKHKKVKLKKLSLELREIIEFHDGGFQDRITKLAVTQKDLSNSLITGDGVKFQLSLMCPFSSPWNEMTTVRDNYEQFANTKYIKTLGKFNPNVPLSHVQGFTVIGKLFSVRYELFFKTKLAGAKDIEFKQQLIVCPFNTQDSIPVLKWIMEECDATAKKFGSNFESNIDAALKRALSISSSKLVIYKSKSVDDWVKIGLGERLVKTRGKVLDYYID